MNPILLAVLVTLAVTAGPLAVMALGCHRRATLAQAAMADAQRTLEDRVQRRTEALLESVAEMETFAYTVSHDLRAPLRAVDGYTQMVLEDEPGRLSPDGEHKLELVRENAQHMGRLIDGLLRWVRLGKAEVRKGPVPLAPLAWDVAHEMEVDGRLGRAAVDVGDLPVVLGDRDLLRIVLVELLANAAKFSARVDRPRISIALKKEAGKPMIVVKDNGVGFDMKHAGRLFGVFQRLHHPADYPGVGIGLACARRILEQHGERIEARSATGEGATFSFSVTLAP